MRTGRDLFKFLTAIDGCISNVLSQAQKKRAVSKKRTEQRLVHLQGACMPMSRGGEVFNFEGGPIGQGIHFQITPSVFDGVKFGCVGRKKGWTWPEP
jgi:hypothetical protein